MVFDAQGLCLVFSVFLPEYAYQISVVIYVLLKLDVTCVNWLCSWVSRRSF